jgi:hypothetical protein
MFIGPTRDTTIRQIKLALCSTGRKKLESDLIRNVAATQNPTGSLSIVHRLRLGEREGIRLKPRSTAHRSMFGAIRTVYSMKFERYCFAPSDRTSPLDDVISPERRHIDECQYAMFAPKTETFQMEAPGEIEICVLIFSRRLALPTSVDSGNLGPHKGRHLVEFA